MVTEIRMGRSSPLKGETEECGEIVGLTRSVCPECLAVLDARIIKRDGKVLLAKECPQHGIFVDTYFSDAAAYDRFSEYRNVGAGLSNPLTEGARGCPLDCGICPGHRTQTLLANIDVTNRCNMHCPICFANAERSGYVYEPTKEEIREMMVRLRSEKPVPCYAVQFAGGEPTVRDDLPELLNMAKELGFYQIMIATNGLRMARSKEYCAKLKECPLYTIYLQFDGVTPEPFVSARGFNALPLKHKALRNLREVGLGNVVLVPTLVRGVNDSQVFDIVRYAIDNIDIVRGVNFQPVSFTGRIDRSELQRQRLTIPDFLADMERQSAGAIKGSDFFPVPCVSAISDLFEAWTHEPSVKFTVHPHCGAATYVFLDRGEIVPITRFIDVESMIATIRKVSAEGRQARHSRVVIVEKLLREVPGHIDNSLAPADLDMPRLIRNFVRGGTGKAMEDFHNKSLLIGAMHFQDPYNFDVDRVKSCGIHYATPDGRVIPFCTYNTFYRQEIEKKFARPVKKE